MEEEEGLGLEQALKLRAAGGGRSAYTLITELVFTLTCQPPSPHHPTP